MTKDDALPDIKFTLHTEEIREKPKKLRMTIDTRSQCGWLQTMTHGFALWECEALHGREAAGWTMDLLGGWGYHICPKHSAGGELHYEAQAGLEKRGTLEQPE